MTSRSVSEIRINLFFSLKELYSGTLNTAFFDIFTVNKAAKKINYSQVVV